MKKVSVIVPVYNTSLFLDDCISSILDQDYKEFELLLINDGSTDNSLDICNKWKAMDSRIRVYSKTNGGLSDTRNCGIQASTGDYITFIDSDDYVSKNYLSYLLKLFSYSDKCSITTCNRQMVKEGKLGHKFNYNDKNGVMILSRSETFKKALYTQIAHGAVARLYRKEVFDSLKFPIGLKHEDTYMLGDFVNSDEIMVFGDEVGCFYRINGDSIVHSNSTNRLMDLVIATKRFGNLALACDENLRNAVICKVIHAELSVLSLIKLDGIEEKKFISEIKQDLRENSSVVLKDREALKRDKIAIVLLKFGGIKLFRMVFEIYSRVLRNE